MPYAEVRLAWKTQAGHRHQVEGLDNEDAVFVTQQHPLFDAILMVADGMGGHPRPREASELAVRAARELLFDPQRLAAAPGIDQALSGAIQAAHAAVRSLWKGSGKPPGTTLSIAVLAEGVLHVGHVGDGSVYLVRDGASRVLAGGETRRAGNRPAQFLGQDLPVEIEGRQVRLAEGDRLLLCTDGLTRYFHESGAELLERVVGRSGVEIGSIASQLTAHARPGEYDDDTTVALAEVTRVHPGDRPAPARTPPQPAPAPAPRPLREPEAMHVKQFQSGVSPLSALLWALLGAALLATGFAAGRWSAPRGGAPAPDPTPPLRTPATPQELSHLPSGNLILMDELGRRVFTVPTRGGLPGTQPLQLHAFQVGAGGRFVDAGTFRLDPGRGELTDPDGRRYPVEVDLSHGTVQLLRGGTLDVQSRPSGARVTLDGRGVGAAPQRLTVPAGRHRIRVEGRTWTREGDVDVVPGGTVTWSAGPQ